MKASAIVLCCAGLCACTAFSSDAQFFNSSHVPPMVRSNFEHEFPKAREVTWTNQDHGYQANFKHHHREFYVLYDERGNPLVQITEIPKAKLPRRVKRQLKDNYTAFSIEAAVKIKATDGEVTFETQIGRAEEAYDLIFNRDGYLLSVTPAHLLDEPSVLP